MTKETEFFDSVKETFAPFNQLSEFGMTAAERAIQWNLDVAGDVMDFAVDELRAFAESDGPAGYMEAQTRIAKEYAGRAQQRFQAAIEASTDTQQSLTELSQKGFAEAQKGLTGAFESVKASAEKVA
jgi:hypothetical protein